MNSFGSRDDRFSLFPVLVRPRYNCEMGNREIHPVARLIAGAIAYVLIVTYAIWTLGSEAWSLFVVVGLVIVAAASPFVGAGAVWLFVRFTNRRDDRQHDAHGPSSE